MIWCDGVGDCLPWVVDARLLVIRKGGMVVLVMVGTTHEVVLYAMLVVLA